MFLGQIALWASGRSNNNDGSYLYGWRQYLEYGVVANGDIPGVPVNTPLPTFYAAKLLNSWGRGGDAVVSTSSNYPLLSVYAAKLQNGDLALLVINKHATDDLNAQITLNSFTPGSTTAAITSYGKSNDLSNFDLSTSTTSISGSTISYTFPSYSMSVIVAKAQLQAAAPAVTLAAPTGVTATTATFHGTVNPNGLTTAAQFEYGPTTSYGSATGVTLAPNDGTSVQNVSSSPNGLQPGLTYHYRLTATNSLGTTSTTEATFTTATGGTITLIPWFTTQPQNQTAAATRGAQFTSAANGTGPLAYQWYFNGTALADSATVAGSTTPTLTLTNVLPGNQVSYTVEATNVAGSTSSSAATLTVDVSAPGGTIASDSFSDGNATSPYGGDLMGLVYYWFSSFTTTSALTSVIDDSAGIGTGNALLVTPNTVGGRILAEFNNVTLVNTGDFVQLQFDMRFTQQPDNGGGGLPLGSLSNLCHPYDDEQLLLKPHRRRRLWRLHESRTQHQQFHARIQRERRRRYPRQYWLRHISPGGRLRRSRHRQAHRKSAPHTSGKRGLGSDRHPRQRQPFLHRCRRIRVNILFQ